jgi:hypothetical protein
VIEERFHLVSITHFKSVLSVNLAEIFSVTPIVIVLTLLKTNESDFGLARMIILLPTLLSASLFARASFSNPVVFAVSAMRSPVRLGV